MDNLTPTNFTQNVPNMFEKNLGQAFGDAKFILRKSGYILYFLSDRITIGVMESLPQEVWSSHKDKLRKSYENNLEKQNPRTINYINLYFTNCNKDAEIVGENELATKFHYFSHNLSKEGVTNVNSYSQIRYNNIYPNIDVVFYSNGTLLEHDFIVKPNGNPQDINLTFEGHDSLGIDDNGNAEITVKSSKLKLLQPNSYQDIRNIMKKIESNYVLDKKNLSINIGNYDNTQELIIDPSLIYSTFLGGNSGTKGQDIAVDDKGNAYVTGVTDSANFPITNPIIGVDYNGSNAVFVTKFNTSGQLIYSTYINGDGNDYGSGIAIDLSNNAYVTGFTTSSNYPTTKSFGVPPNGSRAVFVTKLNAQGDAIVYSAYINGDSIDIGNGIEIDLNNNAYVTGATYSSNYPTTKSFGVPPNGSRAVFVTKLNAQGDAIVYSAYINGDMYDYGSGIAIDLSNNAYVTGVTASSNYPTTKSFGVPPNGYSAVFVTKLNAQGDALVYSAYIHGDGEEVGNGIAIDLSNNVYVTGLTYSSNYPTTKSFGVPPNGNFAVFVTKLNALGDTIVYSAYINGDGNDYGFGIAVDLSNNAYVTGATRSSNYPTTKSFGVAPNDLDAVFVTKVNVLGDALVYSAYIHGDIFDIGKGIALDLNKNAYVTGNTTSSNFPTINPYQPELGGVRNAFVLKLANDDDLIVSIYNLLTNPYYGLEEIKIEVSTVENTVLNPNFGLQSIEGEVSNISTTTTNIEIVVNSINNEINSPTYGLQEIKAEVSTIENTVLDPNFGLQSIEGEVSNIGTTTTNIEIVVNDIDSKINNPTYGLQEIKAEVTTIEGTVLDPSFGLKSIEGEVSSIGTTTTAIETTVNELKIRMIALEQSVAIINQKINYIIEFLDPCNKNRGDFEYYCKRHCNKDKKNYYDED